VGTFELQPPGKRLPNLRVRPGARFGKPLEFSRYYGMESDRAALRAVTDEIMRALAELSGQEYVEKYAQQAKQELQAARKQAATSAAAPAAAPPDAPAGDQDDVGDQDVGDQDDI
jgi:1-acyl-sn-glycerol-3-phosphate acyltransferase